MQRVAVAALCAVLLFSGCASVPLPHPSPEHKISGCFISCAFGYSIRAQHLCRGDRRFFLDISITGEDDVPGDPAESRWFTGATSAFAEYEVGERLKNMKIGKADPDYPKRYAEVLRDVQRELGDDQSRAAYNKQDVVPTTCQTYIASLVQSRDPAQRGQFPGERPDGSPSSPDH